MEFKKGDFPDGIKIMTVHGSKGLEFDHVILGGISTNGGVPSVELMGKEVGSFLSGKGHKVSKSFINHQNLFSSLKRISIMSFQSKKDLSMLPSRGR